MCQVCRSREEEKTSEVIINSVNNRSNILKKPKLINYSNEELISAKKSLQEKISQNGKFLNVKSINELLEQLNPAANSIEIPEDIINNISTDNFDEPTIQFNNGEIYEGGWNFNNQRDGYGISISPEGKVFKGIWKNDKFGKYGA